MKIGSMECFEQDGLRFLRFEQLEAAGLSHAYTTKDINLRITGREGSEQLKESYTRVMKALDFRHVKLYTMTQVHSTEVTVVNMLSEGEDLGFGTRLSQMDGMLTNYPGVLLSSGFADCAPCLLFDPVKKAQANIHSGWKGTLNGMIEVAIKAMVKRYNSKPEDLLLGIGPHIGKDDFFVQADVAVPFEEAYPELDGLVKEVSDTHFLVDLERVIRHGAKRQGLLDAHIYSAGLSTVAHPELLHSYRRDKADFGIMNVFSRIAPYRPEKLCSRRFVAEKIKL